MTPAKAPTLRNPGDKPVLPVLAALLAALGLAATARAQAPAAAGDAALAPVPPALAQALRAVEPDPLPKQLSADSHFVVSDEKAHWLFRDAIVGRGGALLGVGTDQNYVMAGWARPEIVVLLDFDQVVVDVHAVYRQVFLHCADAAAFQAAWAADRKDEVEGWITAAHPDEKDRTRVVKAYRLSRNLVEWRLRGLKKAYREAGVKTFLDDPEQYRFLVSLFRADRVFAVRGDLTGRKAVRGVAAALTGGGVPLRVLYLSNAEKYFEFTPDYKANMRALPYDDRSVVLRTAGGWDEEISPDGLYSYLVQPAAGFAAWMQDGVAVSFKALVGRRKMDKARPGFGTIDRLPPAPRAPRGAR